MNCDVLSYFFLLTASLMFGLHFLMATPFFIYRDVHVFNSMLGKRCVFRISLGTSKGKISMVLTVFNGQSMPYNGIELVVVSYPVVHLWLPGP